MADFRTAWDAAKLAGDWLLAEPGLDVDRDLETAVVLSILTDARAKADDRLDDDADRRGWWGDTDGEAVHGVREIGSRLWLLAREKQTEETRQRAAHYAREAISWLIGDGVAASFDVKASFPRPGFLALEIVIVRNSGVPLVLGYEWAWDQLDRSQAG